MDAFITVTDAAGHVLFRGPATDDEVIDAVTAAHAAQIESEAAMARIALERARRARAEGRLA